MCHYLCVEGGCNDFCVGEMMHPLICNCELKSLKKKQKKVECLNLKSIFLLFFQKSFKNLNIIITLRKFCTRFDLYF